jgi:hypothetical protein
MDIEIYNLIANLLKFNRLQKFFELKKMGTLPNELKNRLN